VEDVTPDVSAAHEFVEESGGPLAMFYLNGRVELSGHEITALPGNKRKECRFLGRILQGLDRCETRI
jgi:hypothetical protein